VQKLFEVSVHFCASHSIITDERKKQNPEREFFFSAMFSENFCLIACVEICANQYGLRLLLVSLH